MALPLGLALLGGAAQTAVRVGGRRALASGAKYLKQGADTVKSSFNKFSSSVDDAAQGAKNYFSKPKQIGYNKPDYVVDSKGTVTMGANKTYPLAKYNANKAALTKAKQAMPKIAGTGATLAGADAMVGDDEKPSSSVDTGKQIVRAGRSSFVKGGNAPVVDAEAPKVEQRDEAPKASVKKSDGVASVQTGSGNSSKYSLSNGTTSVGLKAPSSDGDEYSGEGLKVTGASVKAFGENIRVGGTGNMDNPDPDPQFEAAMADYEEYKSAGGNGSDLEGFRAFQNKKYAKKASK